MTTGTLQIPRSFFVSERRVYSDWQKAFWRELLSNALDAGASRIRIKAARWKEGGAAITVSDNGCGMTRDIAERVYLCLGASSKSDDAIGGFGRARILTCFAADAYRVRSGDFLIEGQGAEYRIKDGLKKIRGTAVQSCLNRSDAAFLFDDLREVLRESALGQSVLLNFADAHPGFLETFGDMRPASEDTEIPFRGYPRPGKHLGMLTRNGEDFASVNASNGATAIRGRAIVRVNDLSMHSFPTGLPGMVVFDLPPEKSRDIMTASRDNLRFHYESVIRDYIADMRANSRIAAGHETEHHFYGDALKGMAIPKPPSAETSHVSAAETARAAAFPDSADSCDVAPGARAADMPERPGYADETAGHFERDRTGDTVTNADARDRNRMLGYPCVMVVDADATPAQRQALKRTGPDQWPRGAGRNVEILHGAFLGAVRHYLGILAEELPSIAESRFTTGLCISRDTKGMHQRFAGTDLVMFCPYDEAGRPRYALSRREDLKCLAATAMHEVAHVAVGPHNEDFANVLTRLAGVSLDKDLFAEMGVYMDVAREIQERRAACRDASGPSTPAGDPAFET